LSTWPADLDLRERFSHRYNSGILGYLEGIYPFSAHGDLAEELLVLARDVPDANSYCPNKSLYAYWFLYANTDVIFAFAVDMRKLSFRLPGCALDVLADGGERHEELGSDWFRFEAFLGHRNERRSRLSRWLKRAYAFATGADA